MAYRWRADVAFGGAGGAGEARLPVSAGAPNFKQLALDGVSLVTIPLPANDNRHCSLSWISSHVGAITSAGSSRLETSAYLHQYPPFYFALESRKHHDITSR